MKRTAGYWIGTLQLQTHIEGGAYTRTYCSQFSIPSEQLPPAFHGARPVSTAIYFLLQQNEFSALHCIASDELWHFYYGDPLIIYEIDSGGLLTEHLLGNDPSSNEFFQCAVKGGSWFGSKLKSGGEYALVGCTVAPGFDFADFKLAKKHELLKEYPQHTAIINMLSR